MTDFTVGRFPNRRAFAAPAQGEIVDLYADDTDAGLDDEVELGADEATVTTLQLRPGAGGRRVYRVTG